jgi:hypothetical protein
LPRRMPRPRPSSRRHAPNGRWRASERLQLLGSRRRRRLLHPASEAALRRSGCPKGCFAGPKGCFAGPKGCFAGPKGCFAGPKGCLAGPKGCFAGPTPAAVEFGAAERAGTPVAAARRAPGIE